MLYDWYYTNVTIQSLNVTIQLLLYKCYLTIFKFAFFLYTFFSRIRKLNTYNIIHSLNKEYIFLFMVIYCKLLLLKIQSNSFQ